MQMNERYYTARKASEAWGVSVRMISKYCTNGEIEGAQKLGNMWIIPRDAKKPADRRYKEVKNAK